MNNNKCLLKTHLLFLYNKDNLIKFMNKNLHNKYTANVETYNKLFITQILDTRTRRHMKYKENLIEMEIREFLRKYYYVTNAFRKVHLISIINSSLIKPFPNFVNMGLIYVIMQKNLTEKQYIINDNLKFMQKTKKEENNISKENNYQFINKYCDSLTNIFESNDSFINEYSKQFNTKFYIDPQDKDDSIIYIENLIQHITTSKKRPVPKEQAGEYGKKSVIDIENVVKITPKVKYSKKYKDKSKRIGAVSTLMQRLSSYETSYKGFILRSNTHSQTRSEKKGITPFENDIPEPKRKQSDVILTKGNSLFSSKLQRIIFDNDKNNKHMQINSMSTNTDKTIYEKTSTNQHFLSTKVFLGKLKEKKHKKIKLFIKPCPKLSDLTSLTTKQHSNAISLNTSNEFFTERTYYERHKNQVINTSRQYNTICLSLNNNDKSKNRAFIKHCKTEHNKNNTNSILKDFSTIENSINNEIIKSSIHQHCINKVIPTKTFLRSNKTTKRNYKSSLHNNGNGLFLSNHVHNSHYTSNSSLNYYKTSSHLTNPIGINRDNNRNNSLNYCLSIKKKHVKHIALFLRKETS